MAEAVVQEVNGVPCDKMFGAIAKVRENAELAQFRFSAKNEWINGTASQSSIHEWHGMGGDHLRVDEMSSRRPARKTRETVGFAIVDGRGGGVLGDG